MSRWHQDANGMMLRCLVRTTVTFDDDVARLISDEQHRERKTFKEVVNEAVRRGLTAATPQAPDYQVRVHHSAVRPGVDTTALNRLADDLENDALIAARAS